MLKGFLEKVVTNPALVVFIVGLVIFVIAAFGQLPIGENVLVVDNQVWRIALAVGGAITTVWGSILLWSGVTHPRRPNPITFEYDVFVASPMAGLKGNTAFQEQLQNTLAVIAALQSHCGVKTVYYAGKKITSAERFEPTDVAAEVDLEAIRKSRTFLLLYPSEIVSSVLFEAGFALALGRTSIYFVQDRLHLPYLMRSLPMLSHDYPEAKVYTCRDQAEIIRTIEACGKRLVSRAPDAGDE
jgi:hypothetical protein